MTFEQFENLSLAIGIPVLIGYMMFIIFRLGKDSNAGRFGYFVLFFALGLGTVGFIAKHLIVEILGI